MPSDGSKKPEKTFTLSRRHFLQGVSAGAAATVLAPEIADAQPAADREIPGRQMVPIQLRINGAAYRVRVEPSATLLDTLRDQLDLTGTKRVCDRAECGACTVLVDGKPIYSCTKLAVDAQEQEITTIESLTADGKLHPLQEAFLKHDALQCGFCTPGVVMACKALLDQNPNPTLDDVKTAVSGSLCKCGTYPKVFRATLEASETIRRGR
jgi:aerobic-type carbon monoxide dehydrogenase small subunit (CoxS/CutS family)